MLAFVRDPNKPVHPLTIGRLVHSTMVTADVAGSLLGVMKGVFTPALQSKEQWPESIRRDFGRAESTATWRSSPSRRTSSGARPSSTSRKSRDTRV